VCVCVCFRPKHCKCTLVIPAGSRVQEAKKPNWDANASVPISLKKKQALQPAAPKVWSVSADDGDELMDEDALLGEDDLKAKPKEVSECVASNGKKACKNCSCGLAEKLAEGEDASTAAPTSACGSVSPPPALSPTFLSPCPSPHHHPPGGGVSISEPLNLPHAQECVRALRHRRASPLSYA